MCVRVKKGRRLLRREKQQEGGAETHKILPRVILEKSYVKGLCLGKTSQGISAHVLPFPEFT